MEAVEHEVRLPKETYELGLAVLAVTREYKKAKADGWSWGADVPQVLLGCFQDLMKALEGVEKIPNEFRDEPMGATLAILVPVLNGLGDILKK